jgi:hypothetical protein
MRIIAFTAVTTYLTLSSLPLFAATTIDLVAAGGVKFAKGLDDDVSGAQSQHVSVPIRNIGNAAWHNRNFVMRISFAGLAVNADIYGPTGGGSYVLGSAIAPGQTGMLFFSLPLGTLSHCQRVALRLDTSRNEQIGAPSVFANDSSVQVAVDTTSIRTCIGGVQTLGD